MEIQENSNKNRQNFYTAFAIVFVAIIIIYPLAYIGMMLLAYKLA